MKTSTFFEVISFHLKSSGHGHGLVETSAEAIVSISIEGGRATPITAHGKNKAMAIFDAMKRPLLKDFPKLKCITLECSDTGMKCKNGIATWPVKPVLTGSDSGIVLALAGSLNEIISGLEEKSR